MAQTSSRPPTDASLPVIQPDAAGVDIGSVETWACVAAERATPNVRKFGMYTADLYALVDWLVACQVKSVAMEATGVYWIPLYELLEARGLEVKVVNARQLKRVPGRKSDVQDCQWIQRLHSVGLLSGSFRPEGEMCVLRAYLRQRSTLLEHRAAHIQHRQKALHLMNVHLTHVLSDITGQTGLAILRAIVGGEQTPTRLASYREPTCKYSEADFVAALTGNYRTEHVFALKQALALYDAYTAQVVECDAQIERQLATMEPASDDDLPPLDPDVKRGSHSKNAPSYDARSLLYRLTGVDLVAISGLNESTVQTIVSEVGVDMGRFPSEKHFCSWLGLAPHNDISGGKVLRSRTPKTRNRAGQAFRLAAQSVSRSRDNAYGAFYRRQKARLGPAQAIVATAHKLARTFYPMLKHRVPFEGLSADEYQQRERERERLRLEKRAARLGLALVQLPSPAPTT